MFMNCEMKYITSYMCITIYNSFSEQDCNNERCAEGKSTWKVKNYFGENLTAVYIQCIHLFGNSLFQGLHFELVFELTSDNHDEIRRPSSADMQSSPLTQIAKYVATNSEVNFILD